MKGDSHQNTIVWPLPTHDSPLHVPYLNHIPAHGPHVGRHTPQPVSVLWSASTLSPSFLLASDIFEPNFYRINTPTYLKPSHFSYLLAYEDGTECSETSAYKIQTMGNYAEESIKHSEHGESLKSVSNDGSTQSVRVIDGRVSKCNADWVLPNP